MSDYAAGPAEAALGGIGAKALRGFRCTTCFLWFTTEADRADHTAGSARYRYCRPLERLRQLGYVRDDRSVWGRPERPARTKPKRGRSPPP